MTAPTTEPLEPLEAVARALVIVESGMQPRNAVYTYESVIPEKSREKFRTKAGSMLSALAEAGMVVVPVEPSEDALDSDELTDVLHDIDLIDYHDQSGQPYVTTEGAIRIYRAVLAALQKGEAGTTGTGE